MRKSTWKVLCGADLNNDNHERIILFKTGSSGKKFMIMKEGIFNGKKSAIGKNFDMEQVENGEVREYLEKISNGVPEEQMTWLEAEEVVL